MIDSNNNLKKLSQALIDSVRGVMEAKDGGVPKTEKQKDLAAKAPPHDKITHADVLAARGVLKKHPVHGKLVVAKEARHGYDVGDDEKVYEEVEELDELSRKTPRKGTVAYDLMMKRKKQYHTDPVIEPKDQMIGNAKVVTREEVEDLEELSTKTLDSYRTKARNQIIAARNKDTDTTEKRLKGYTQASKSISKNFVKGVYEEAEDLDEAMDAGARFKHHHDHAKALLKSIGDHLKTGHEAAMKSTDYKGRKGPNWGHVGSMEHVATQLGQIHDMLARKGEWAESVEVEDEVTLSEEVELTQEEIDRLDAIMADLDEGKWNYPKHMTKTVTTSDMDTTNAARNREERKAFRKKEKAKAHAALMKGMRKEDVELDEARGRPRKNPLPAGQQEEPEPRQHIIQQLQRAKLSMQGGAKVKFKDGTTHDIAGKHASKLLDRYAGMKPAEKEAFQKKIGSSHADLKSEL